MSNITPGIWQYWDNVGEIHAHGNPNKICDIPPHGALRGADENRANAHAIAAIPRLLEAARCAVAALTQHKTYQADIDLAVSALRTALDTAEEGTK